MKDEKSKHGGRLWRTSSPGMKSMMGSAAVVSAADRWDSQSGVKGQVVQSHPHRCQHTLNTPQFSKNQYQAFMSGFTAIQTIFNKKKNPKGCSKEDYV